MPNFDMSHQPKYPLITVDTNEPITVDQISTILDRNEGATLCVRQEDGHPNRGGHFFCIHLENETVLLETMEQDYVDTFSLENLVRFINHASGLSFDRDMQLYCQNSLNFRDD